MLIVSRWPDSTRRGGPVFGGGFGLIEVVLGMLLLWIDARWNEGVFCMFHLAQVSLLSCRNGFFLAHRDSPGNTVIHFIYDKVTVGYETKLVSGRVTLKVLLRTRSPWISSTHSVPLFWIDLCISRASLRVHSQFWSLSFPPFVPFVKTPSRPKHTVI